MVEDTPERIEADQRTIERWHKANGTNQGEMIAAGVEKARQNLRSMTRV